MPLRPSLRVHAPAALVVLGVLLPLGTACLVGEPFDWSDTSSFFAPIRRAIVEALREGRLPLWNPTATLGLPVFAEGVHGVLHPISLLSAALDPSARIEPVILAYFVVAALGAYALARAFGTTETAAFVAGVAYGLSGYVVSMGTKLVYLAGAASLPWMLAAGRAVGTTGTRGIVAVAIATALAALTGEFQALYVGLALALLFAAQAGGIRTALRTAAGEGLGLALAGVQLVPSWVHLGRTLRSVADMGSTRFMAFSPWRLVEWISPGFFVRYDADAESVFEALAKIPGPFDFPWAASVFIGAPIILLVANGVRDRTGRVLLACTCVALWTAFGHHLGASQLLAHVPLWGKFRYAEKMIGPFTLLVAILAARGLDGLRGGRTGPIEIAAWTTAAIGVLLGAAALLGAFDGLAPAAGKRLASGAVWIVAGSAAMAALLRASRRPTMKPLTLAGLAAAVYVGSASAAHFAHRAGVPVDAGAVARRIPADPLVTRVVAPYPGIGPAVEGGDRFDQWVRSAARLPIPNYNLLLGLDTVDVYSAFEPTRYWAVRRPFWDERWKLFRRFGASHAVICWPIDEKQARIADIATGGARFLYQDEHERLDVWELPHRGWAVFASGVQVVPGPGEAVEELERLWRLGREDVIVEASAGERPFATSAGRILGVERRAERLRIEAEADGPAFLVVNDAWWEGWEAAIDGTPVPIHVVDGLVRGVRWPAGRHVVEMAYRPPELRRGAVVTAVALAALVALVAAGALRRRRAPA